MRALLDVNLLIALLDAEHDSYALGHRWLNANLLAGWASCPLTENGCLRVMTNPRYSSPLKPDAVLARLEEAKSNGHHEFWPDDLSITDPALFNRGRLRGHQQVTDVYLLALAVKHGGKLVTFDQRINRDAVVGSAPEHLVTLSEPRARDGLPA